VFDWLKEVAGPNFAPAALWTALALVVLVLLLVIMRIVRSMTFGTFVAGGRNRKTRLAVMDAAPVDSQRRLVLVRRDDVEHLILIGGPTDVVVERDIRLLPAARRPAGAEPADSVQRPRPADIPGQPRPERPPQAARPEPRASQPLAPAGLPKANPAPPAQVAAPRMPPASMPAAAQANASTPRPPTAPAANTAPASTVPSPATPASAAKPVNPPAADVPPPTPRLKPLENPPSSSGTSNANKARPRSEMTLEDEMNRLLGELSGKK
jgi:Flagellar biosynthesis protein, FliO